MNLLSKKIFILIIIFCFTCSNAQKNKISIAYNKTFPEKTQTSSTLNGFEFEFERKISKSFSISGNIEFDRLNTFPNFTNGGLTSQNTELQNYIFKNVKEAGLLWQKVNQQIYTANLNYYILNKEKNKIYATIGGGLNIQDALEYGISDTKINIYQDGHTELIQFKDYYQPRTATTFVMQAGFGYDYDFKNNWVAGANLRLQMPLARDKYYFKHGGFGFDETLRLGFKIGKRF